MQQSLLLIAIALVASCMAGCATGASGDVYLATYFLDNGEDGVYLAASKDGLRFAPLLEPNIALFKGAVGKERLVRDACIMRGPDNVWHAAWTTGWFEAGFGIAHSANLVDWSAQTYVEPMKTEPGTVNCWAPEIAWDAGRGEYLLLWSSTIKGRFTQTEKGGDPGPPFVTLNHRIYCTTTKDFGEYAPGRLYCDPGFNCIDATLLPPASGSATWHLFLKDETRFPPAKNIRHLQLVDPEIATGAPSGPITGSYWAEGPTAFRIGGKTRVFFDRYTENRFGALETEDFATWTDISQKVSLPAGARHATIFPVPASLAQDIRDGLRARSSSGGSR